MKKTFLAVIIITIALGCKKTDEATIEVINHMKTNHITFPKELEYCVIIPGGGCDNCIAEGIGFVKNNLINFSIDSSKIQAVFTAISSKKILLNQLSIDNYLEYNFIFDVEDKYYLNSQYSIYPCIIYLDKGNVINVEYQNPQNSYAISKLTNKIKG